VQVLLESAVSDGTERSGKGIIMNTAIAKKQSEHTTILVSNLAQDAREEDIQSLFERYGSVSAVRLILGATNRRGDGCCSLKMKGRQAKAAISALDGKTFRGSILRVSEAHAEPSAGGAAPRVAEDEFIRGARRLTYEVASVDKAAMPAGIEGDDWYRYVLSSGRSRITGFHRGSREEVEEYANHCAEEFNLRSSRGKSARPMAPAKKT
jgi:RNA recognition motif-containing protein